MSKNFPRGRRGIRARHLARRLATPSLFRVCRGAFFVSRARRCGRCGYSRSDGVLPVISSLASVGKCSRRPAVDRLPHFSPLCATHRCRERERGGRALSFHPFRAHFLPLPNGDDVGAWGQCDDDRRDEERDDGRRPRRHLQDIVVVRGRQGSAAAPRLLRPAAGQAAPRRPEEDGQRPAGPARTPASRPATARGGGGHGPALPFGHPLPAGRGGRSERRGWRTAAAAAVADAQGAGGRERRFLVRAQQRVLEAGARPRASGPLPQDQGGGGAPLQSARDPAEGHDGAAARQRTNTLPLERAKPAGGDLRRDVLVHQQRRLRPVRHRPRGRGRRRRGRGRGGGGGGGRAVLQRVRPQLPFEPPAVSAPGAQAALRVLGVRRLLPGPARPRAPQGGARTLVRGRGKHLRERLRQRTGGGALCRRRDGKAVVDASAHMTSIKASSVVVEDPKQH